MPEAAAVAVKSVDAGLLVVLFALLGTVVQPKRFAGLFSAAPSIALANLTVEALTAGDRRASQESLAMIVGAAGFVVFCLVVRALLRRIGPVPASAAALAAWGATAVIGYFSFLR